MDAIVLAAGSAALFGAMTVLLRAPLARGLDATAGAFLTVVPAILVAVALAVAVADGGGGDLTGLWPFALAGVLGPGISQVLFTLGVRDAGPSRASVTVGTAPLFSVAIALVFLDEPLIGGVVLGAVLIVAGGVLLAGERGRPAHVKAIGLVFALAATVVFAIRDNLVRWLSGDTTVEPSLAAATTLVAGGATILAYLLARRVAVPVRALRGFATAGIAFGLSYVFLFEAYYRGRVTIVSPIVATESLWAVGLSALFLRRVELVGRRLLAGALLIVVGGALIAVFR
jgi:drug/metabolite transporter (DMT)-like permease